MTQDKFYALWDFFKTWKIENCFWDNFDFEDRQSVRVKIPSHLFWQLNTAKCFPLQNEKRSFLTTIFSLLPATQTPPRTLHESRLLAALCLSP